MKQILSINAVKSLGMKNIDYSIFGVLCISNSLKGIASEKGLSSADIAKLTGLHADVFAAALEGYPMTPISHFLSIASAIGCVIEARDLEALSHVGSTQ